MTVKNSIFASKSEEKVFRRLENDFWSGRLEIYPNLPFSSIFDIESLSLDSKEKNFLLKTSIDYTVTDKSSKPLLCVEFDGMCMGFSRNGEYIQVKEDLERKRKLDLKLKMAREAYLPFYVVSYKETEELLKEGMRITVLHSIIGQTLAYQNVDSKIREHIEMDEKHLKSLPHNKLNEHFQQLVLSAEVDCEFEWDPVVNKVAELAKFLREKKIILGWSLSTLLPRREGWVGCKVSCKTPRGTVEREAWVRDFDGSLASPMIIVQWVSELLVYHDVAELNGVELQLKNI